LVDESRVNLSLIWAAHNTRDVASHLNIVFFGDIHHLLEALEALLDRAVDVLASESLAGCAKDSDLVHS